MSTITETRIPLWFKLAYTAFCAVLVPTYLLAYGPTNFLYFCDVALLTTLVAIWLESPLLASAEDLASGHVGLPAAGPLDAVILKESIHHVADRRSVLDGLTSMLSRHGRILVVMLPTSIQHPLFQAAHDRFEELQPEPDAIAELLRAAGLRASVSYRTFHTAIERQRYIHMLESRYMSVLDEFSESELTAGIEQFRRAYRDPVLRFDDHFAFVTGWVRPG